MHRPTTRRDYAARIDRVMRHIGDHLDADLDIEALANIACFSPYHFHRIYRALAGETVVATIRRNRLQRAGADLVRSDAAIEDIARRAGYGSVAAFTRAFGAAFGMSPAAYRKVGTLVSPMIEHSEKETSIMFPVEVTERDGVTVVALPHRGPYMEIATAFERLNAWARSRGIVGPETRSFGIYYDDPQTVPADRLRAHAAMTVPPRTAITPDELDGALVTIEIAGGRHAVMRHQGPYSELESAYRWLYGEWLANSGEEPADRPCFEEYVNDCRKLPPEEWRTDICLPLR